MAELLLVMGLSVPLLGIWAEFGRTQSRAVASQQGQVRVNDTLRIVRLVLQSELRYALPAQWIADGGDSLAVRAVRGGGPVCATAGNELAIRYSGVRAPDASKDSVLLVSDIGIEVAPVIAVAPTAACTDGLTITLESPPADPPLFTLLYERGTYSVTAGALRYRRGAGGRQPMTEQILGPGSGLSGAGGSLVLTLRPEGVGASDGTETRFTIHQLNDGAVFP
jgi:hypothetical protein